MKKPSLDMLLNQRVVLDTAGPLIYIGRLETFDDRGYWLGDADLHDRSDGHCTKEEYVSASRKLDESDDPHANRRRIFVDRQVVCSISMLEDVL